MIIYSRPVGSILAPCLHSLGILQILPGSNFLPSCHPLVLATSTWRHSLPGKLLVKRPRNQVAHLHFPSFPPLSISSLISSPATDHLKEPILTHYFHALGTNTTSLLPADPLRPPPQHTPSAFILDYLLFLPVSPQYQEAHSPLDPQWPHVAGTQKHSTRQPTTATLS